jgi:hypothetical protein
VFWRFKFSGMLLCRVVTVLSLIADLAGNIGIYETHSVLLPKYAAATLVKRCTSIAVEFLDAILFRLAILLTTTWQLLVILSLNL